MTKKQLKEILDGLPFTMECYPFDEVTTVYKVGGKMFALYSDHDDKGLSVNLKNTPENNFILRDMYEEIVEGYHMNKTHWNTIYLNNSLEEATIVKLIEDSYHLVFKSLTKKVKLELEDSL